MEGPERELPDPGLAVCCQKCDQKQGALGRSTLDADGTTVFILYGLGRHARPEVFRGRTSFEVVCPYHGSRGHLDGAGASQEGDAPRNGHSDLTF